MPADEDSMQSSPFRRVTSARVSPARARAGFETVSVNG
jgi:hypothetical protein